MQFIYNPSMIHIDKVTKKKRVFYIIMLNTVMIFSKIFHRLKFLRRVAGQTKPRIIRCSTSIEAENYGVEHGRHKLLKKIQIKSQIDIYLQISENPPLSWTHYDHTKSRDYPH